MIGKENGDMIAKASQYRTWFCGALLLIITAALALPSSSAPTWEAQWIWLDDSGPQMNALAQARREIQLESPQSGIIYITADSRYRLYVNGEWIGDGPVRCFPHKQQYDEYDITRNLHPGANAIAVEVMHWGEETFQYLIGKPGLFAQLEIQDGGAAKRIVSDAEWKIRLHPGHERRTQRIACQQAFEEILDGRNWDASWQNPAYDDSQWNKAFVRGGAGTAPWTGMEARSIPYLTREPVYPLRALSVKQVQPPSLMSAVNIRYSLCEGNLTANHLPVRGVLASEIFSPVAQTLSVRPVNNLGGALYINGKRIINGFPIWSPVAVDIQAGENLVVYEPGKDTHWTCASFAFDAETPVHLEAALGPVGAQWAAVCFDRSDEKISNAIRQAKTWDELTFAGGTISPVDRLHVSPVVAYNAVWGGHEIDAQPKVSDLNLAFSDAPGYAVIEPSQGDTQILLDFGKELIGLIDLELEAPEGVIIDAAGFEAVEDGRIHWSSGNLCSFRYTTRDGYQRFLSRFRRGFRYAYLVFRNVTEPVKLHSVRTLLATYPDIRVGSFACSDPLLNKIWETGVWTLRMCSEDTFTDCPLYEQTYWVGDGRNEALVSYPVWGPTALTRRCAILPGQSLFRSPLTESQVPSGWQNIIPAWSFLWVQLADEYYLYSGDVDTLKAVYPDVKTLLDNCQAMCTDRGLFSIDAWNFFDWAGMDNSPKTCTHNNLLLAETAKRGARMAKALGLNDDVQRWESLRQQLIDAVNNELWNGEKRAYIDSIHDDGTLSKTTSQQTNSLALLYEAVPNEYKDELLQTIINPSEGMVKAGSPFSLFYVLEELAKENRSEEILSIIRKGWKPMLDKGATTFWETFPGYERDWWSRSHCHAWSAAPTFFLSACQLGVQPSEPGFAKFRIAPKPVDLSWCQGEFPTPAGVVPVSWNKKENGFELKTTIPAGTTAEIVLPVEPITFGVLKANGQTTAPDQPPQGIESIKASPEGWIFTVAGGQSLILEASR